MDKAPAIFINGYIIPSQYSLTDLELYIYDIIKMVNKHKKQEATTDNELPI